MSNKFLLLLCLLFFSGKVFTQKIYTNENSIFFNSRPIAISIDSNQVIIYDNFKRAFYDDYDFIQKDDTIKLTYKDNNLSVHITDSLLVMNPVSILGTQFTRNDSATFHQRPQLSNLPTSYNTDTISFLTKDGIQLKGELIYSEDSDKLPLVILITGSGPQTRYSEIFGHELFKVLASHLSSRDSIGSIACLLYDERGIGLSEGSFYEATTETFMDDAIAAIRYAKNNYTHIIDTSAIGVIGHSEGALIGALIGAENMTDFQVLLGLPSIPMSDILIDQAIMLNKNSGMPDSLIRKDSIFREEWFQYAQTNFKYDSLFHDINLFLDDLYQDIDSIGLTFFPAQEVYYAAVAQTFYNPWLIHILKYRPDEILSRILSPTFVVYGEHDVQVSPELNYKPALKALEILEDKTRVVVYPKLNHLMQISETGNIDEYIHITETFNLELIYDIKRWIISLQEK